MNVNKIEIGDYVSVLFTSESKEIFRGTVLGLPCQGAEYFTIKDPGNRIYYVGWGFSRITLWTKKDHVGTSPVEDYTREEYQKESGQ